MNNRILEKPLPLHANHRFASLASPASLFQFCLTKRRCCVRWKKLPIFEATSSTQLFRFFFYFFVLFCRQGKATFCHYRIGRAVNSVSILTLSKYKQIQKRGFISIWEIADTHAFDVFILRWSMQHCRRTGCSSQCVECIQYDVSTKRGISINRWQIGDHKNYNIIKYQNYRDISTADARFVYRKFS